MRRRGEEQPTNEPTLAGVQRKKPTRHGESRSRRGVSCWRQRSDEKTGRRSSRGLSARGCAVAASGGISRPKARAVRVTREDFV
jgi:hypothetical protein